MAFNANMGLNFDAVPSIEDVSSSLGDYLGAVGSDAWGYNPTVALFRGKEIMDTMVDMGDVDAGNDAIDIGAGGFDESGNWQAGEVGGVQRNTESALSIEDQQKLIDAEGLTGKIKPQEGYNAQTLRLLFNRKHQEFENALVREQAPAWMAPIGFLGTLAVSMLDPINVASSFMPVVSQARQLTMLQRASGAWGRAGARALVGVAEGAAGAAAVEPVLQLARSIQQADYEMYESLINIAFGSVMGATLHTGKGVLGEWIRNKKGLRHEWEVAVPTDESEVLRQQMAQDILSAAKEAGAEKIGTMEAEAAAIIFDVRARQWAYDFRENGGTIGGFYEKYAPDWKAATRRIVDNLNEAEFREAAGMDMDGIAAETGWRKGENGKWQYVGTDNGDVLYMTSILSSSDPRINWRTGTESVRLQTTEMPLIRNEKENALQAFSALDGKRVKTPGLGEIKEVRFEKNKGMGEARVNRSDEAFSTYRYVEELLSKAEWFRKEPNIDLGKGHVVHAVSRATIGGEDYAVVFTLKSAMDKEGNPYWRYYGHKIIKTGDESGARASSAKSLQPIESSSPVDNSILFNFLKRVKDASERRGGTRFPDEISILRQRKGTLGKSYTDKQRAEAEAMAAQRQTVEPAEPVETIVTEETTTAPMGEEQGRITFNALEDGRALIELFKAADATTPPHELYHLFRRQMAESATDSNAPQRVRDMYQQVCDFVGAEPGKAWTVEQEEKFARAGERFLHEGKAPTANLQSLFDRMKDWFTEVYGAAEEHGFEISDDMRKLFGDMMLSPSVDEAGAAFRYSLGRLLEYNPAEGADVHPAMRPDGDSSPEAIREMQDVATARVEQRLEILQQRMPEREIEAFRAEFDEAMRMEDEAAASVARHGELLEEALMCEMRSA